MVVKRLDGGEVHMDLGLRNKNALIIASSQGLGKAVATLLVKEGANVMLSGRDESKLKTVQRELEELAGGKVAYCVTDITKNSEIVNLVNRTNAEFGGIELLVNNAGGPKAGAFSEMSDDDWQHSFELNLLSYIRIIRETLPFLQKQGGKIVNIASSSIKEPIPGLILSNTFRTAIVGLSKTLATELASDNILINTVGPGRIATDRVAHLDQINADKQGVSVKEMEAKMKAAIPLGRYGEPEEFANLVTFLLSEANSYLTGQTYLVDGGSIKSI